jgi:hypothetical protein
MQVSWKTYNDGNECSDHLLANQSIRLAVLSPASDAVRVIPQQLYKGYEFSKKH